jgi:hypothetical protein
MVSLPAGAVCSAIATAAAVVVAVLLCRLLQIGYFSIFATDLLGEGTPSPISSFLSFLLLLTPAGGTPTV